MINSERSVINIKLAREIKALPRGRLEANYCIIICLILYRHLSI